MILTKWEGSWGDLGWVVFVWHVGEECGGRGLLGPIDHDAALKPGKPGHVPVEIRRYLVSILRVRKKQRKEIGEKDRKERSGIVHFEGTPAADSFLIL